MRKWRVFLAVLTVLALAGCSAAPEAEERNETPEPRLSSVAAVSAVKSKKFEPWECDLRLGRLDSAVPTKNCDLHYLARIACNSPGGMNEVWADDAVHPEYSAQWDGRRWSVLIGCGAPKNSRMATFWLYEDTREVVPSDDRSANVFGIR